MCVCAICKHVFTSACGCTKFICLFACAFRRSLLFQPSHLRFQPVITITPSIIDLLSIYLEVSIVMRTSQNGWLIMEILQKIDDLGVLPS